MRFILFLVYFLTQLTFADYSIPNIKDMSIYSIASHENLQVAVGEDISEDTRRQQQLDEYYKAAIAVSSDRGKTWQRLKFDIEAPLVSILMLDETTIITAASTEGFGGEIYKSTDLGKTWKTVYSGGMLYDLKKTPSNQLLAAGFGILQSDDNGNKWKEGFSNKDFFTSILITRNKNILTSAINADIYLSLGNKKNWKKVYKAGLDGFDGYQLIDDGKNLKLIGVDGEEIAKSTNEGESWK